MNITPSSSRALRQRLWVLFNTHSIVEAEASGAGRGAPAPALTKSGFHACVEALIRRGSFRGLFIGSESSAAILDAAAQLQTPTTQERLWNDAVAYDGGRLAPQSPVDRVTSAFTSNDHFADDDFFGERCYRSGDSPGGQLLQSSPGNPHNTFTTRLADGALNISWAALYAVVVLYLFDHHHFVHSFLESEVAALRSAAATPSPAQEDGLGQKGVKQQKALAARVIVSSPLNKAKRVATLTTQATPEFISPYKHCTADTTDVRVESDRLLLHSQRVRTPTPRRLAERAEKARGRKAQLASVSAAPAASQQCSPSCSSTVLAPPLRKNSAVVAVGSEKAEDEQRSPRVNRLTGDDRRAPFPVTPTNLDVVSPRTCTPTRGTDAANAISAQETQRSMADDLQKPAPPPLRGRTQRDAAELSPQQYTESSRNAFTAAHAPAPTANVFTLAPPVFPLEGPFLSCLHHTNQRSSNARSGLREPHTPPAVSCPSVSVSVSSSSSRGLPTIPAVAATAAAVAAASTVGPPLPRRTSSVSPPPRRPGNVVELGDGNAGVIGVAVGPPLPAPLGGGLRLRSPSAANAVQARGAAKERCSHGRASAERCGGAATTKIDGAKAAAAEGLLTAQVEMKRPKLACAAGKLRDRRRVYTTRRPHAAAGQDENDDATNDASLNVPGSRVPHYFAHPQPTRTEAWPGRHRESSIELLPPPTTRHEERLSSRRTSSPSPPCIPPGTAAASTEDDPVWYERGAGRSGTVEHTVESRCTTAQPVQMVDGLSTDGGTGAAESSQRPEGVHYASPEKPQPLPSSREALSAAAVEESIPQQQPPTQTSRRREHQPLVEPQPSPFSTTREPFPAASNTPSRYASTTLDAVVVGAARPSSTTATAMREGHRQVFAAPRVTAPSPTPTPTSRDESSDGTAPSLSSSCRPPARGPSPQLVAPASPKPKSSLPPPLSTSAPAQQPLPERQQNKSLAVPPQQLHKRPQPSSICAPSPPVLIGVPRILSSTFTSPLMSAGVSVGPASSRQHSDHSSMVSQQQQDTSKEKRECQVGTSNTVVCTDLRGDVELARESCSCCRTPPRHWSPDAAEVMRQTPAGPLSPVGWQQQQPLPTPSPLTTPRRAQPAQRLEVTTPPPRLSHRARVRSSSRGSGAVPTPPRVPQTRMQQSPSGSLQVTPRRRAPST
jgi:hypothetical protein